MRSLGNISDEAESQSTDTLLGGRVILKQPRRGYRVAIDPIFLAAAVPAVGGEHVLDVGTGVGADALCLLARVPGVQVTGIECQAELAELARSNAQTNDVGDEFAVLVGDIAAPPAAWGARTFDHVMTNPPYLPADHGHPPSDPAAAIAERESTADLNIWVNFCLTAVAPGGTITFVHRYDRLGEVTAALEGGAGDMVICPLWPKQPGEAAKRVIVQATKGAGGVTREGPGIVLHQADGTYSAAAKAILEDAAPVPLR